MNLRILLVLVVAGWLVGVNSACAQLLIKVGISTSGSATTVTFTATSLSASTDVTSGYNLFGGITFGNFFTTPATDQPVFNLSAGSTLMPASATAAFTSAIPNHVTVFGATDFVDLNLYRYSGVGDPHAGDPETFSSSSTALVGVATLTFDSSTQADWIALLPTEGTGGTLYAGNYYFNGYHEAIGTWEVVPSAAMAAPEPSSWVLLLMGMTVLIFFYFRRARHHQS